MQATTDSYSFLNTFSDAWKIKNMISNTEQYVKYEYNQYLQYQNHELLYS